ncbi:hypothetical protein Bbelb_257190 [Branchiostoma belcheri]|nr:hypothetical protein Bbelb_257190 [Branchiostoma belcheri]
MSGQEAGVGIDAMLDSCLQQDKRRFRQSKFRYGGVGPKGLANSPGAQLPITVIQIGKRTALAIKGNQLKQPMALGGKKPPIKNDDARPTCFGLGACGKPSDYMHSASHSKSLVFNGYNPPAIPKTHNVTSSRIFGKRVHGTETGSAAEIDFSGQAPRGQSRQVAAQRRHTVRPTGLRAPGVVLRVRLFNGSIEEP